jgi:hypothetical protein
MGALLRFDGKVHIVPDNIVSIGVVGYKDLANLSIGVPPIIDPDSIDGSGGVGLPEELAKDIGGKGFGVPEVHRILEKGYFLHAVNRSPETGRHLIRLPDRNDVISDRVDIDRPASFAAAPTGIAGI